MADAEIEIEHEGVIYVVNANFDTKVVDDSFDGHLGGYVYTFEQSHRAVDEDTIDIESCINEHGDELDPDSVPGLTAHIIEKLQEDYNDS